MDLKIKNFSKEDKTKILDLFRDVFHRKMSEQYWDWRYDNGPINGKYIKLMWDQDSLVGHYAAFPIELIIGDEIIKAGMSMTSMTSPQYSKMGIFRQLGQSLYEESFNDLNLIWGFPNDNVLYARIKYLNWTLVKDIPMYQTGLDDFEDLTAGEKINRVESFSDDYNTFVRNVSRRYSILINKDSKYLNWRYKENPVNQYCILESRKHNELQGFCVYKYYFNDGILNGYIVDLLVSNEHALINLVFKAMYEMKTGGAHNAYIWMTDSHYLNILKDCGFKETERLTHFGCRINTDAVLKVNPFDFENWYLVMGDSDVF